MRVGIARTPAIPQCVARYTPCSLSVEGAVNKHMQSAAGEARHRVGVVAPAPRVSASHRAYVMHAPLARGGMGTVHLGRLLASAGFSRTVAIKRLHPHLASDPSVREKFAKEARIAARVTHANVVAMLDVVADEGELLLVMEYVHGVTLSTLTSSTRKRGDHVPPEIAARVLADTLHGLHAAHEATDTSGEPLRLIHRDVSPQNILVGADGVTRVADFGIAKALSQDHLTVEGALRGKLPFMAPEQLLRSPLDRRVDVYAAGVVLWEVLAGRRLFEMGANADVIRRILDAPVDPPSRFNSVIPAALDAIVMRAIDRDPDARFGTAREMALALEATTVASTSTVATWVESNANAILASYAAQITDMERPSDETGDIRESDDTDEIDDTVDTDETGDIDDTGDIDEPNVRMASVVVSKAAIAVSSSAPAGQSTATLPSLANPGVGTTTATTSGTAPVPGRKRERVAPAIAICFLLAFGVVALKAIRRAPPAPSPTTASPVPSSESTTLRVAVVDPASITAEPKAVAAASAGRADLTTIGGATVDPAPIAAAPTSRPASTGRADVSGGPPMKWCKIYDAEKQIFTVKPVRAARCP